MIDLYSAIRSVAHDFLEFPMRHNHFSHIGILFLVYIFAILRGV